MMLLLRKKRRNSFNRSALSHKLCKLKIPGVATPGIFLSNFKLYTVMKKEDLLNDDFLKQFKSGEELNNFLKQVQKRGIEKMLDGELDGHLGYDKNQKSDNPNPGPT